MHNLIPFWILDYGIWILDCVPPAKKLSAKGTRTRVR